MSHCRLWLLVLLLMFWLASAAQAQPITSDDHWVTPRLTVRAEGGDSPSYNNGFAWGEFFYPLSQIEDKYIVFLDLRGVNFYGGNLWEGNAGGGLEDGAGTLAISDSTIADNLATSARSSSTSRSQLPSSHCFSPRTALRLYRSDLTAAASSCK